MNLNRILSMRYLGIPAFCLLMLTLPAAAQKLKQQPVLDQPVPDPTAEQPQFPLQDQPLRDPERPGLKLGENADQVLAEIRKIIFSGEEVLSSAVLDPIAGSYTLEVSSPGLDRPLFLPTVPSSS